MDYYSNKLCLAQVDKKDNILGKIERWEAHKKAILHRGFTVILFYNNKVVLQHRKHPAFDNFWDLTFSSHQMYLDDDRLQDDLSSIYETSKREWNIDNKGFVAKPKFLGKIYYKSKDPKSIYSEHEIDYIFSCKLRDKPIPNLDYSYGYDLINPLKIKKLESSINFAPWVNKILEKINFS